MFTKQQIQKIKELERQKKLIDSQIKALKRNTNFDFRGSKILNNISLTASLRTLLLTISAAEKKTRELDGSSYIIIHKPHERVRNLSTTHIKECNNMLKELAPIINKYIDVMVNINTKIKEESSDINNSQEHNADLSCIDFESLIKNFPETENNSDENACQITTNDIINSKRKRIAENFIKRAAIQDMQLSTRITNCLLNNNINYVSDIIMLPYSQIYEILNSDDKCMREIIDNLENAGINTKILWPEHYEGDVNNG